MYDEDKKTILIVDDEQSIIDILVYNLKKEGYNTIEANDGMVAVEIALEKKPDLILLDIMLPKMDGLTACKKIKNTLNVPILILSAKDEELDKESTCAKIEHVGNDNKQQYFTSYYNLDMIISIGFRVNSKPAIKFRTWANAIIKDYRM